MVCSRGESLTHHINQMKLFNIFLALTLVAAATPASVLANASPEATKGMKACQRSDKEIVSHEIDYNHGKKVAELLNLSEANDKVGGISWDRWKVLFMTTRKGYAISASMILSSMGQKELSGCWMASLKPLKTQAWSSQHAGLTDHLSPALKAHYFSLAER